MKKILILYPHFPPSNLAGVHRARLFAQHLPSFGWEPIILTVHERFYEETLDYNLAKLLPSTLRIEKVNAFNVTKPRLFGDIGIRAFFQLYKKGKQIIFSEKIDFLYIPIPSFYCALLGRWLNRSTNIKYGIDYIDPWVHNFPGSNKTFSRHWFSTKIAKLLEPIAIKSASLITGVAEGYYKGVIERNPKLLRTAIFAAMPYGGDENDHKAVKLIAGKPYLFQKKEHKLLMVYAGAMLPKAYEPLEQMFKSIHDNSETFSEVEFHFIGTGKKANDPHSFNIKPLAEQYNLWETIVFEYPQRIPYLDVLIHLNFADGIFILGSTEPHYTPSKVYQAVLSARPILAILHSKSTATTMIEKSKAGLVLAFDGEENINEISTGFPIIFKQYLDFLKTYTFSNIDVTVFEKYSAKNVTSQLATLLHKLINRN